MAQFQQVDEFLPMVDVVLDVQAIPWKFPFDGECLGAALPNEAEPL